MKTKLCLVALFLFLVQACVEDDNFPQKELVQYTIKTKVIKSGVNVSNHYEYAYGIGAKDTLFKPMFSKDFDPEDSDFDSILPLHLNIFKDTTTFVLVDKSKARDTVQLVYQRNAKYYNTYALVYFSDMKVNFVSHRVLSFNIRSIGSSQLKAEIILK